MVVVIGICSFFSLIQSAASAQLLLRVEIQLNGGRGRYYVIRRDRDKVSFVSLLLMVGYLGSIFISIRMPLLLLLFIDCSQSTTTAAFLLKDFLHVISQLFGSLFCTALSQHILD